MESTKVNIEINGEKILDLLTNLPKIQNDVEEIKVELKEYNNCKVQCSEFNSALVNIEDDISDLKTGLNKIHTDKTDFQNWLKRTITAAVIAIFITTLATLLYKGIKYDRNEQKKIKTKIMNKK